MLLLVKLPNIHHVTLRRYQEMCRVVGIEVDGNEKLFVFPYREVFHLLRAFGYKTEDTALGFRFFYVSQFFEIEEIFAHIG